MMSKKFFAMIAMLVMLIAIGTHSFAQESSPLIVTVPFVAENAAGTVVMDAINGAPAPEQSVFSDISEGAFRIAFSVPGDYFYKVHQEAGTQARTTYDDTVYDVGIYVHIDENRVLNATVIVSTDDGVRKSDGIVFTNKVEPVVSEDPSQPKTGDESNLKLWVAVMVFSFLGICVVLISFGRRREQE